METRNKRCVLFAAVCHCGHLASSVAHNTKWCVLFFPLVLLLRTQHTSSAGKKSNKENYASQESLDSISTCLSNETSTTIQSGIISDSVESELIPPGQSTPQPGSSKSLMKKLNQNISLLKMFQEYRNC